MDAAKEARRAEKAVKKALREIKDRKSKEENLKPLPQVLEAGES